MTGFVDSDWASWGSWGSGCLSPAAQCRANEGKEFSWKRGDPHDLRCVFNRGWWLAKGTDGTSSSLALDSSNCGLSVSARRELPVAPPSQEGPVASAMSAKHSKSALDHMRTGSEDQSGRVSSHVAASTPSAFVRLNCKSARATSTCPSISERELSLPSPSLRLCDCESRNRHLNKTRHSPHLPKNIDIKETTPLTRSCITRRRCFFVDLDTRHQNTGVNLLCAK